MREPVRSADFILPFFAALAWAAAAYCIQIGLHATGVFPAGVNAETLNQWDAGWYERIALNGYDHESRNTGFFVLLPWIWRYRP